VSQDVVSELNHTVVSDELGKTNLVIDYKQNLEDGQNHARNTSGRFTHSLVLVETLKGKV
jgi:hypothetical protein